MDRARAARAVLAAGAAAYALSVAAASQTPGPRAWGLHLPGFLPPSERFLVMALLFGGASLLALDFLRGKTREHPPRGGGAGRHAGGVARERGGAHGRRDSRRRAAERAQRRKSSSFPRWAGWLLLFPLAWFLWRLETRTHFLGDGTVWLASIGSEHPNPYSEPLAAATWKGFALVLRGIGLPFDSVTAGLLSILCGVAAAAILWGIAAELTRHSGSRVLVFAVLATLGIAQLYFGYIESYPPTSVAILGYLWLGLRRARGADHPVWLAAALAITTSFHLVTLFLVPSYFYLLIRDQRPLLHRAALAVLPLAGAAGLLVLLGYPPARWPGAFQLAARAVEPGGTTALAKPYPAISIDHGRDLLNEILLALPIPALLLLAAAVSRLAGRDSRGADRAASHAPDHPAGRDPAALFLALAAVPGLLLAVALVLPVSPAQDWDLIALLLLPLALFGVKVGCSIPGVPLRGTRGAALAMLGAGALLSFVLVNANAASGLRRYETLVGPDARITPYARAYGNELLATYDVSRKDFAQALLHSQRALDAEPTNPRYWIKKGAALYELGRYREAIPVLEEGIRRGPARDDAYYDLGNSLAREKSYAAAVANFREAIRLGEPRPDYYNNLGVALFYLGKTDSARVVWNDVVRRWPSYALAKRSLAQHFGQTAAESLRVSPTPRPTPPRLR